MIAILWFVLLFAAGGAVAYFATKNAVLRKKLAEEAAWYDEAYRRNTKELVLCESVAEGHPHFGEFQRGSALKAVRDLRQKYDTLRGPAVVPSAFPQWESSPGAWCDNCGEVYAGD